MLLILKCSFDLKENLDFISLLDYYNCEIIQMINL